MVSKRAGLLRVVRVLLIEDSNVDAAVVRNGLKRRQKENGVHFEVERVAQLRAGIRLLETQSFDSVLLDLTLPDSWGVATLQTMRRCLSELGKSNLPVIVLSSSEDPGIAEELSQSGAVAYLPKREFSAETLIGLLLGAYEAMLLRSEEKLQRRSADLEVAGVIQANLLPRSAPCIHGFDVAGTCLPAEQVGGDCYDWFSLPDSNWGFMVGDVCGHGPGAAIVMAGVRQLIRVLAPNDDDPATVLATVNRLVYDDRHFSQLTTLCYARLCPHTGVLTFVGAGQPLYVYRSDGSMLSYSSTVPPLGVLPEISGEAVQVQLRTGDLVIIPTDGLYEARNQRGDFFEFDQLRRYYPQLSDLTAATAIQSICNTVSRFDAADAAKDDRTVIGIKVLAER
ncbi:MAG: PP2C family protein-serine/threonine phosphatase [Planctomycetota bacterium]|jgi:serine phosphatase RsbU (regulator of sigma subunit)